MLPDLVSSAAPPLHQRSLAEEDLLPFEAKSLEELLKRQVEELPTPPSERDPAISRRLSQAILRGLSKIPAARPPSATALAAQLRAGSEGKRTCW